MKADGMPVVSSAGHVGNNGALYRRTGVIPNIFMAICPLSGNNY
jgi:hypothetical protein